jgi:hypothetical protein
MYFSVKVPTLLYIKEPQNDFKSIFVQVLWSQTALKFEDNGFESRRGVRFY